MSYIKITPYADGIIQTTEMSKHLNPPVPEFEETPWGKARVVSWETQTSENDSIRKSIARTKEKICMLAHNMIPEWFGTLTFSPEKVKDRKDATELRTKVSKWLENCKLRKCPDLKYLVVPERHKDGAWHMHILLSNASGLEFIDSGKKYQKQPIYNLKDWKYGFTNFTKVNNPQATAFYMSKYITKDIAGTQKNRQRYLVSKNIPVFESITTETSYPNVETLLRERFGKETTVLYEKEFNLENKYGIKDSVHVRKATLKEESK